MKLHPKYVVDEQGSRKEVILSSEEFSRLMEIVEDQLDAVDLDQAIKTDHDAIPYQQVRDELRAEGRL